MTFLLIAFGSACLVGLAFVPVVMRACVYFGITDRPDSHRKLHQHEVPLGGGIAIYVSTLAVLGALTLFGSEARFDFGNSFGLLIASTLLMVVGVADDALSL